MKSTNLKSYQEYVFSEQTAKYNVRYVSAYMVEQFPEPLFMLCTIYIHYTKYGITKCNKPGDSDGSFLPLPGALPALPAPLPRPPAFDGFFAALPLTGFFFTGVVLFLFEPASGSKSLPLSSSLGDPSNRNSSSSLSSGSLSLKSSKSEANIYTKNSFNFTTKNL